VNTEYNTNAHDQSPDHLKKGNKWVKAAQSRLYNVDTVSSKLKQHQKQVQAEK